MCHLNMKFCWDVLVQQLLKQIGDIQDINFFKHAWKIFNIGAIVIPSFEHIFPVHYIFSSNI